VTIRSSPIFRVGATSYVIPGSLLENAHFLAGRVRDMELVLFDLDGGPSNLPSPSEVEALAGLGAQLDLSYTVHLPLDLLWDGDGEDVSLLKARRVIELTRPLQPQAFVAHLDGRSVQSGAEQRAMEDWLSQALRTMERVAEWAGGLEQVALENLEGYPLDFLEPVCERLLVRRCVDVGHLWLDGHDPLPFLRAALPRTAVIHLHGLSGGRDHQSLAGIPLLQMDAVMGCLLEEGYQGVLTLEVFGKTDFTSSLAALVSSMQRLDGKGTGYG
jgi:sugar phosphate isomerase/epimerase